MSTLEEYKRAAQPVPERMRKWHLYGAGLENLREEEVQVPSFGPDELLVRQDACGLCFSDTKVINLGPNHPRLTGRDLTTHPVTLGHEVACTVVGVGDNLHDRFRVGDRFVIQADVFYQGKSLAYGYVFSGGLSEYSVIPKEIIYGDEGCYLLPIQPETGYVESALTEPWACVVSAYAQAHRDGIKHGGAMLVMGSIAAAETNYVWETLLTAERKPRSITMWNLVGTGKKGLIERAETLGIPLESVRGNDWATFQQHPNLRFDDILALGDVLPEDIEGAATALADHGIVNLVGAPPLPRKLSLDIGRIHYNWHYYLGTRTQNPSDAYPEQRTSDLRSGGIAWFIGAGGPMGQMHVQRAVQHAHPPRRIIATDIDTQRLQSVVDRFGATAAERGVELIALNPQQIGDDAFHAELKRLSEYRGFDDIVSMVPVAALIEHAADYLAEGGWFNIFAGVARGTMANLDVNAIVEKKVRYLGSSGSSLADMRETLSRVESDALSTNASLAAIGGMEAAAEGLRAVKEGWFPGKTLIFPHIHDLPLTPLSDLRENYPSVYEKLLDGKFWTQEAEDELLRLTVAQKTNAPEW